MKQLLRDFSTAALFFVFCLILLLLAGGAQANTLPDGPTCPLTFSECLNRDLVTDLTAAGAEPWEISAAEAVASGRLGRGMITFTEAGQCGGTGFMSLLPGREGLGIDWQGDCPWNDPQWHWRQYEWIYSDASGIVQLDAFRRTHGRVLAAARVRGFPVELAAIMGNGGPNRFLRVARELGWDQGELLMWYVSQGDEERRLHRVEQWL